jgi:hypothetical protein
MNNGCLHQHDTDCLFYHKNAVGVSALTFSKLGNGSSVSRILETYDMLFKMQNDKMAALEKTLKEVQKQLAEQQ